MSGERQRYIDSMGTECPACGGTNIEGGPVEVGALEAHQEMGCNDCELEWVDRYIFSSLGIIAPSVSVEEQMVETLEAAKLAITDGVGSSAVVKDISAILEQWRRSNGAKAESQEGAEGEADDPAPGQDQVSPETETRKRAEVLVDCIASRLCVDTGMISENYFQRAVDVAVEFLASE